MVANNLPQTPTAPSPYLGLGSQGQKSTFSEHGHVKYQIKENHKCSTMVATIMPKDPLLPHIPNTRRPWEWGQ